VCLTLTTFIGGGVGQSGNGQRKPWGVRDLVFRLGFKIKIVIIRPSSMHKVIIGSGNDGM